ncbi:MAG: N-acetylmuramoyl-L-alanine amidase [Saprospiraceae bacterium]
MKHNIQLLLCLFFGIASFGLQAQNSTDVYYHKVVALAGDNIHRLLKRFELAEHQCNFDQFYQLNKLNKKSRLLANKRYCIPVLIYPYNGKSIRTTIGIKGWSQALGIKKYNERLKKNKLRRSTIAKSNILWVPHHELYCEQAAPPSLTQNTSPPFALKDKKLSNTEPEVLPEEPKIDNQTLHHEKKLTGYRMFPIFGKDNAYIPLKDNSLRGKIFYIVSGHGGPDSGAVGMYKGNQLCEDEYAYDISLRIVRNLLEHGAIAYMVTRDPNDGLRSGKILKCDVDEYSWDNFKIPRSQKRRLYQRSSAVNKLYERHLKQGITDQTVVALHIDSRSATEKTDVFFYYYPGSKAGKKLAKAMQKSLSKKYKKHRANGKYHGSVTARDLHVLRECKPNSVYIELGNIRNKSDQQRFVLESNRQALADWLFQGLIGK